MIQKFTNSLKWLRQKRIRMIVAALMIVGLLILVYQLLKPKEATQKTQTTTVEAKTLILSVSAIGNMLSANITPITTGTTGMIKKIYVTDDQQVTKGQKLMEIELDQTSTLKHSQNYSSYLSAKNALDSANVSMYTLQSQSFAANQKFINDAVARDLATNDPTYIQEYADWKAAEEKGELMPFLIKVPDESTSALLY